MATESRQLPRTNVKRNTALTKAKQENDDLVAGAGSFLSTGTQTKLNTNQPLYKTAFDDVATKSNIDMQATLAVDAAAAKLRRTCSRFIQVFALAVFDEEFPVANFQLYHLDSNGNVPDLDALDDVQNVAANLISGEATRVAAGGAAMTMPAIAKIIALNNTFLAARLAKRASLVALTAAEAALNTLNVAADDTILFVWNEVETHFSNLTNAAIRVQGRVWGIVYVRTGSTKIITGTVKDSVTSLAIIGANIYFDNGNNDVLSDANGYSLSTTLMDVQKLIATHPLYTPFDVNVTLVENENQEVDIVMVLLP